jgi:hypothetical protein
MFAFNGLVAAPVAPFQQTNSPSDDDVCPPRVNDLVYSQGWQRIESLPGIWPFSAVNSSAACRHWAGSEFQDRKRRSNQARLGFNPNAKVHDTILLAQLQVIPPAGSSEKNTSAMHGSSP